LKIKHQLFIIYFLETLLQIKPDCALGSVSQQNFAIVSGAQVLFWIEKISELF
jgi:hypothetical protein